MSRRRSRSSSRRTQPSDNVTASASVWRLLGLAWLGVVAYWLLTGATWVGWAGADFSSFLSLGDLRLRLRDLVENFLVATPAGVALGVSAGLT
ncbi:MAG: hypothetical protein ACPG4N_09355, partial [Gammaproteobacteria bacterium]